MMDLEGMLNAWKKGLIFLAIGSAVWRRRGGQTDQLACLEVGGTGTKTGTVCALRHAI